MIEKAFVSEIAKRANITEEEVLEGIDNLEIDLYESKKKAFVSILGLDSYSSEELLEFFMPVVDEKLNNTSYIDSWIKEYDGIIETPFGIAYINQLFYK